MRIVDADVRLAVAVKRNPTHGHPPGAPTVEAALADAERNGFRLAVIGRTCALVAVASFYLEAFGYPNNVVAAAGILFTAALGLIPLGLVGGRLEGAARYALFTLDAASASAIVALAPLSSGGDIPQNLVFLSSRNEYFHAIVALSILALSPRLVLWTGACVVTGLAGATAWIMAGMQRVVSLEGLPVAPSREDYLSVVLSPDFLGLPVRVIEGVMIALVTCIAALAVHRARNVVRAHAAAEAERTRVEGIFGRYVPAQVAEQLLHAGHLGPQQREASIIFADIVGFTRLSENLPADQVIGLLNKFFSAVTAIVDERGGVVVNHVGDAIIAAFNAPLPTEAHAARAVGAARALLALVAEREFEGHRLHLRIGVATGPVAAGTVGGAGRETYTLYGDTVNLAQRLEELNKELDTQCLISGTTFDAAGPDCVDTIAIGAVHVRGRERAVEVFAL